MPSSSFYAYFVHVLRSSKQVIQTKIYSKKVSKLSYFCKKRKNCFAFLFWDLRPKSQIFTPHPCPHFENFSLNTLNNEQKPSAKKRLTGPVKNRSTGRSTGDDFEIYRSGRVEKILTGSISDTVTSYTKYVSISLIYLTKRILRTPCSENTWAKIAKNLFWDMKEQFYNHWHAVWAQSHICWTIFGLKIAAKNSM